ncbi:MAG: hypothetical protein PHC51_02090 [bacterium]|nr:hypothetical protein [bacterium]
MSNQNHHAGYSLMELMLGMLLFSLISAIGLRVGQSSLIALRAANDQVKLQQKALDASQILYSLSSATLKNRLIPSLHTYRCNNNICVKTSPGRSVAERLTIAQSADQSDAILALEVDADKQLVRHPEAGNIFCLNSGKGLSEISDSWLPVFLGQNEVDNSPIFSFALNLKRMSPDSYCRRPYKLLGAERTPLWQENNVGGEDELPLSASVAFISLVSADLIYLDREKTLHRRSLLNKANQKTLKEITSLNAELISRNDTTWLNAGFSVANKTSRQVKLPAQLPLFDPLDSIELPAK